MYTTTARSSTLLSPFFIPLSMAYLTRNGPARTVNVHNVTSSVADTMRRRYGRSISSERRSTWTAFLRSSLSSSSTADMKNIAHLLGVFRLVGVVRVVVGCHRRREHV